jgi:hypothetical protein
VRSGEFLRDVLQVVLLGWAGETITYSDVPWLVTGREDLVWRDLGRAEGTEAEADVDVAI